MTMSEWGVIVTERTDLALATVIARAGAAASLAARLKERRGMNLPIGPGTWLATQEGATTGWLSALRTELGDLAAISDQSDGLAVLRLTGPAVRDELAKLVFIDLHPAAFDVGHVACTVAAHVGVTLWRLQDGANGATFELAVPRSYSASFRHALSVSAAEFGLREG